MKMTNYWMVLKLCPNSEIIYEELFILLTEEPCQCSDCQRFYREHDRLIREFPTFKQQQELNWASIQSFRTLCSKVTNELQRELSERETNEDIINFFNQNQKAFYLDSFSSSWAKMMEAYEVKENLSSDQLNNLEEMQWQDMPES